MYECMYVRMYVCTYMYVCAKTLNSALAFVADHCHVPYAFTRRVRYVT